MVYDFSPSCAGEHARNFLGQWNGKLLCDDFAGNKAGFEQGITEIGCAESNLRPHGGSNGGLDGCVIVGGGAVSRRIARAQRCSIKVLICSTTTLPAKLCPGSNWSLRTVAGSSFARSKCAVWPAPVSRWSPAVHASGHPPRRNSLTPRPSLRRNRARRVAPSEYPTCAAT